MRSLQSVQRRMGFETLEAKTLFAYDIMKAGFAIDLPDTAVVAGFEDGDVAETIDGLSGPADGGEADPGLRSGSADPGGWQRQDAIFEIYEMSGPADGGGGAVDHNSTRSNNGIVGEGGGGTTGIEGDFETDNPEGSNPTPHPMPVPELSDSVSKHRFEHSPGMDDEIWTDGTMTNLSEFPARTSLGADRVDHNSARSNGGIVGEGVDTVDYSTESRSDGEQHKIYDPSQCRWNDITSIAAGDGQGIGIFPIPIATPSDHVSHNSNWEVGTNNLSIGSGTMAILNGSVMGDLVNNGMLIVSGDRADSVQGDERTVPLGTHIEPPYGGWPLRAIDLCCEMWALIQAWDNDDIEVRSNASEEALQVIKKEANRIEEQLEREFAGDPLANATFSLDQPSRWEIREAELRDSSCVFQLLRNASKSSNEEVSARAKDVFLKFEPPFKGTFSLDN